MTPKPTAAEIKAYRDAHGCGIDNARTALLKEWRRCELRRQRAAIAELHTPQAWHNAFADLIDLLMEESK
jgi:hypothetical protein